MNSQGEILRSIVDAGLTVTTTYHPRGHIPSGHHYATTVYDGPNLLEEELTWTERGARDRHAGLIDRARKGEFR